VRAGGEVDVHVRHAGRRIERRQQAVAEVLGQREQSPVSWYDDSRPPSTRIVTSNTLTEIG